jgi:hypothetical protein
MVVFTYTYTHKCTYIHLCMYIYKYVCTSFPPFLSSILFVRASVYGSFNGKAGSFFPWPTHRYSISGNPGFAPVYICIYMYNICMYTYINMCLYIYIYIYMMASVYGSFNGKAGSFFPWRIHRYSISGNPGFAPICKYICMYMYVYI